MKWLIIPLLWVLAVGAALLILYRLWRGHNVVLAGRWSPRFIRMVAVVLVLLGAGAEGGGAPLPAKDKPASGQGEEQLPAALTAQTVQHWLQVEQRGGWQQFKQAFVQFTLAPNDRQAKLNAQQFVGTLPARLAPLVRADLGGGGAGEAAARPDLHDLTVVLDDLETAGLFDHWVNAYLWRKTPAAVGEKDRAKLTEWFARLHRHARVTDTLIRARAQVKPFMLPPRAWMGKMGGPRRDLLVQEEKGAADVFAAARKLYPLTGTGTWEVDGCVALTVAKDSAAVVLVRAGQQDRPGPLAAMRLTRLDLLQTPAGDKPVVLEHAWLGRVSLPADRLLSVWDLPGCLSEEARKKVTDAVGAALDGDEAAARRLEQALPFVQVLLREKLAAAPATKGGKLRLILSLFDDAVMPAPPAVEEVGPLPHGGGRVP
jgi:hypothetical protein